VGGVHRRVAGLFPPVRVLAGRLKGAVMGVSLIVVVVVVTALVFDFTNGFHDTANAMATSIATGAFRPKVAVAIAGCLNVLGAFLSVQVAKTISGGLVDETLINPVVIFAGLVGAIMWNLMTWLVGLPSSSSHALFGGLIGATWVAGGVGAIHADTVVNKVILPAVLSPVVAALIAVTVTYLALRITDRARPGVVRRGFRMSQTVSASMVALAHGTNDAQKTMGVITLTLITAGLMPAGSAPPFWVVMAAGLAIGLGTYAGGWRIIRTLGTRVSDIRPAQGFSAETTSAAVILSSTHLGLPLSTTQVCTGSIFGAGAGRRLASVHWGIAGRIVLAWSFTLPAAAVVGAAASWLAATGTVGVILVAVTAVAAASGIYAASRRTQVTAANVNDGPQRPADLHLVA
jgi:PiT family inorganic phosphate transporter